jgi:hypothetical protein
MCGPTRTLIATKLLLDESRLRSFVPSGQRNWARLAFVLFFFHRGHFGAECRYLVMDHLDFASLPATVKLIN